MAKDSARRDLVLLHNGLLALVLGYPLSIALSGVLNALMRLAGAGPVAGQLTMWVVYPLWACTIALVFLLPSKRACWRWLALANALAAGACWCILRAGSAA
ncbi:hypothetical protein HF313_22165 [Massilia atriviolacea]|uniref:Iron transporter n=1 Tax=Massilia atriviolacea TaxID=2495579 RepID=A0A430HFI4_9BURK|nr:hypothetical protein [Massilia atriviolacea]RSZ56273.1 hypothetical protein EJB06_25600 [Massilia atriviolacea]